ncbi:MAG: PQQ-binding-like beta-propeller repeat protein [Planctomycetales bacterium]|nr:PQQ-binding-like beta-propeller repeat protein [Planctomycetales bacterium]
MKCVDLFRFVSGLICLAVAVMVSADPVNAEDWPQWRGVRRDAKINDSTLVDKLPEGRIPLRWSVPVGPGYSGPTVSNGAVYLSDRQGESPKIVERILCFDAQSGI